MYIRAQKDGNLILGNKSIGQQLAKNNLYSTAYPFDRCLNGGPASVAFVAIHGYNGAVTTSADLWVQGGLRTLPTSGFTIGVSSSSASDAAAGTGARTIEIDLLDTNYVPHTITLTLNGQTKVVDTNYAATAFRINDIRIKTWGTGLANAGDLYVYDSSDTVTAGVPQTATKIFQKISATGNTCRGGFYTVPAGCQLQTSQIRGGFNDTVTTDRSAVLSFQYYFNTPSGLVPTYFPIVGQMSDTQGNVVITPDYPVILDEKTDLMLRAVSSSSSVITAFLDAVLFYK